MNRFVANRWLDKGEGDGKIEVELRPTDVKKKDGGKYLIYHVFFLINSNN